MKNLHIEYCTKAGLNAISIKAGDTIITWQESREGTGPIDLALSFQDREGCNEVWNSIQESCRFSTGALSFGNYGVGNGDDADTQEDDGNSKAERNAYIDEIPVDIQTSGCMYIDSDVKPK